MGLNLRLVMLSEQAFAEFGRTLLLWNPARYLSAIAQAGNPKPALHNEAVSSEKPEGTEQKNCLRLLEEAKANEEGQSTKIHRVADDSVRTDAFIVLP